MITSLDELVDRYHRPSIELTCHEIDGREDRSDQSLALARMQNTRQATTSSGSGQFRATLERIMHHALRFSIPDPEKVTANVPAVDRCSPGRRPY